MAKVACLICTKRFQDITVNWPKISSHNHSKQNLWKTAIAKERTLFVEESIVYSCEVTRLDNNTKEYYTGMTGDTFKKRLYGHNETFRKAKLKNKSKLSKHIWSLKDSGVQYSLKWKVLGRAKAFNPVTGVCRLCLLEKYYIMFNPKEATLNSRDEIYGFCKHKRKFLMSTAKTWKFGFFKKQNFHFLQPNLSIFCSFWYCQINVYVGQWCIHQSRVWWLLSKHETNL